MAKAEQQSNLECEKRNNATVCRGREAEAGERRRELGEAVANRALTQHADKLEGEIAQLRSRLNTADPVRRVNSQAVAITQLLRLPERDMTAVAYWQSFIMAVMIELVIVGAVLSFELMREAPRPAMMVAAVETKAVSSIAQTATRASTDDDVTRFFIARVEPVQGKSVLIGKVYAEYCGWCVAGL